ncbi:MAG: hypothetical protein PHR77_12640 [Kiritimatiellae bacterium]|nr:hypothetical protein [Kiritimatiellia bacterium]MDD5522463.1 hypothetical protein [Kiritimatiellia bacterium]
MKTWNRSLFGFSVIVVVSVFCGCATPPEWKLPWNKKLDNRLPVMGKDNWIIVADSSYPCRRAAGIETIATKKNLPAVLNRVLSGLDDLGHASATAWICSELEKIPDRDAIGITKVHHEIRRLLNDAKITIKVATEQEILKKIAAETTDYNVLVLKSGTPLPYTSVYLHLDCRYWDEDREKRLRDALRSSE